MKRTGINCRMATAMMAVVVTFMAATSPAEAILLPGLPNPFDLLLGGGGGGAAAGPDLSAVDDALAAGLISPGQVAAIGALLGTDSTATQTQLANRARLVQRLRALIAVSWFEPAGQKKFRKNSY